MTQLHPSAERAGAAGAADATVNTENLAAVAADATVKQAADSPFEAIPIELTACRQWVGWSPEKRDGKLTKVPKCPRTGWNASVTDSTSWGSFEEACNWASSRPGSGIGFVLTADDDYAALDLDKCIEPDTGGIAPWAESIIRQADAYTEVTPSGGGLRIVLKGRLRGTRRRKGQIEMYDRDRFVTITGNHLPGTPTTIEFRQDELGVIYGSVFDADKPKPRRSHPRPTMSVSDDEVVRRIEQSKDAAKFRRLWSGDSGDYGHDDSAGDLAFCNIVGFWGGRDPSQIDRFMRASPRMREKWDRKARQGETYGEGTIRMALDGDVYQSSRSITGGQVNGRCHPVGSEGQTKPGRPAIITNNRQLRDVGQDAYDALVAANDPPVVFARSDELVRVITVEDEGGRPKIKAIDAPSLRAVMSHAADFYRVAGDGKQTAILPPRDLVEHVHAMGEWRSIPPLVGVTEVPVLRPDGSILLAPGYDRTTRLVYQPSRELTLPRIPDQPTREQAGEAAQLLLDLLADFPFVEQADRANALAGLITPAVRPMISGDIPLKTTTAPNAGTGKTLTDLVMSAIYTGRQAAVADAPASDTEFDKRILAELSAGPAFVVLDNIDGELKSPSLARLLTAQVYSSRVLGVSKMAAYPNRTIWLANGNNLRLGGDLPRRCYWVRMDAKKSRPEKREDFRIKDLESYAREHRGELIAAALTMARAWVVAGRPEAPGLPRMGSFTTWVQTVGGILAFAGVNGFLGNADEMYEAGDQEGSQWLAFLSAWHARFPTSSVTTAQIEQACKAYPDPNTHEMVVPDLQLVLPDELADAFQGSASFTRVLGKALAAREGRRYGDDELYVERAAADKNKKVARWRVMADDRC